MTVNDDAPAGKERTSALEDLTIGRMVPDFLLSCVDGKEHKLSDFRGSKVLLCFYRHSYCPMCAYSVGKIIGNYKKLAWAAKLKVITVFHTDLEWLQKGLTNSNAPIACLCDEGCYPFLALSDPEGTAGSKFKVESIGLIRQTLEYLSVIPKISEMHGVCTATSVFHSKDGMMEVLNSNGGQHVMPSEFLIDEDGVLIDVLRAKNILDSMDIDRIAHFLLHGERLSSDQK